MKKLTALLLGSALAVAGTATCAEMAFPNTTYASVEENEIIEEEIEEESPQTEEDTILPQENPEPVQNALPRRVVVFGGGKVSATPDVAYITIGVESQNSDLQEATAQNNAALSNIIEYLKANNLTDDDIKTKYYSIFQRHDYTTNEQFQEYQISSGLEVRFTDLENLTKHVTEMTNLGANRLGNVTFDCQDTSYYYQEALKLAVEDAKNKASALAGDDLTIKGICEECVYTCLPYRIADASVLTSTNTILKGSMEIEAKIKVIFE